MTFRRRTEEIEDGRGRRVTAVEEPIMRDRSEVLAEDEVVTSAPGAWNVARGWVRVFALMIGVALGTVETVLGFRLAFLLGEANATNGFVDFIYDLSDPLVEPFQGIFANETFDGGGLFEPATVIAMAVNAVAAALLIAAIMVTTAGPSTGGERLLTRRSRHREDATH